uniref:PHD-type domain-containing protein n=1 Tax=Terrapene triunguis TaxID=2587831 RepID=A0A674JLA4_9SAUR
MGTVGAAPTNGDSAQSCLATPPPRNQGTCRRFWEPPEVSAARSPHPLPRPKPLPQPSENERVRVGERERQREGGWSEWGGALGKGQGRGRGKCVRFCVIRKLEPYCCLFCSPSRCFQTCCVCGCKGASIACQGRKCTKNFHFPCGSERGCIYQFFGEFKSFCWKHRPVQRQHLPTRASCVLLLLFASQWLIHSPASPSWVYASFPCRNVISAPRFVSIPQGHALRAALYHFRCPRCRDMGTFQREMFRMGIKIPDRDAAWEEDGAFSDQYHRHSRCDASCCLYVGGREQFAEVGPWQLLLCNSCGSQGTHRRCASLGATRGPWECEDCAEPAGAGKERLERRPWDWPQAPGPPAGGGKQGNCPRARTI